MILPTLHSTINFDNSLSAPLYPVGPLATITLGPRVVLGFGEINGIVFYDAGGTAGDLDIEQSIDLVNWDQVDTISPVVNAGIPFAMKVVGKYMRVRFTDTGGIGGTLRFAGALRQIFTT